MDEIYEIFELDEIYVHTPRRYKGRVDPFKMYDAQEFRRRYRFTKEEVRIIIDLVRDDLVESACQRGKPISVELKVLATLSGYARKKVQDDTAQMHGFSQSTMSRINVEVSRALALKLPQVIRFPTSLPEQVKAMQGFQAIANMPQIISAIDCTHIRIKKTGGDLAQMYINRKNYYSLNVQVMCDADCRITNIVAGWRGSAHDSRIFNECVMKRRFENGEFQGRLIGDSGYASAPYMLTPVLNPATRAQEQYNEAHCSTRNVIERLFGQWKQRFRCLLIGLNVSLETAKTMIVAMSVLHNLALDMRRGADDWSDSDDDDERQVDENPRPQNGNENVSGNVSRALYIANNF